MTGENIPAQDTVLACVNYTKNTSKPTCASKHYTRVKD